MACPIHSQPAVQQQPVCFPPPCPSCESLRTSLAKAGETIRRLGEEWLRDPEKLRQAEEDRDYGKRELKLLREKFAPLREKCASVEKRAIAGDGLADAVRFHSRMRNPESKKQSWRKLMDALEVHVKA